MLTNALVAAALLTTAFPPPRALHAPVVRARRADSLMAAARSEFDSVLMRARPIVQQLTAESDVVEGIRKLRAGTGFVFPSADSVLAAYRAMTRRAQGLMGRVMVGAADGPLIVEPYAEDVERRGGPPSYAPARPGSDEPPRFLVNRMRTERMSVADAVAHEAWPGHHVQMSAAAAAAPAAFNGEFVEGWGVYAETLGDAMGLYDDALSRAGYLVHLADVAMACYLDIGRRNFGWTRTQLIDSMMILAGRPRAQAEVYADRHAATPGQLATYFVGYRAIRDARRLAEQRLGAAFDLPKFNYEVIRHGSMPVDSIAPLVNRWADSVSGSIPSPATHATPFNTAGAFFAVSVPTLDASVAWYETRLGLSVVMRPTRYEHTTTAVLEGGADRRASGKRERRRAKRSWRRGFPRGAQAAPIR